MHWIDSGIVLGARRFGESSVILELLTAQHGRHLGLVRGGRGRRHAAALQPGNSVRAEWRARLDDQLGVFAVEPLAHRAAGLIGHGPALFALAHLAALARLLPERDPQPGLHAALEIILDALADMAVCAPLIVRFEVEMLRALGFGLDLTRCAATGRTDDLAYVSPRTGRAVSRAAGAPYHERLLPLPAFLSPDGVAEAGVLEGFRLTEHFLRRHVYDPRGLAIPEQRAALVAALTP